MSGTSTKIILSNERYNVGMHNARNHGNNNSSSKDDSTIMRNPLHHSGSEVAHDCTINEE